MATVDGREITVEQFMQFLAQDASRVPRATTVSGKAELLRDMIAGMMIKRDMVEKGLVDADVSPSEFGEAYAEFAAERFAPQAKITDERLRSYYEANRNDFGIPASVRLSQIQIHVPDDATAAEKEQARTRAEQALARLEQGEPFSAVAMEMTENPNEKGSDGDLGFVWREGNAWLERALEGLEVGEHTGVLESPVGYDIIKLTDERDSVITPFDQVKEHVRQQLVTELRTEARDQYVRSLAADAEIELVLSELKQEYPQGLFAE
jgi:parvulin-like peptidyl-prolyl isomerase